MSDKNIFLFSVDLEDIRLRMEDGMKYNAAVERLVDDYLFFLNKFNSKATFFVVGDIPKTYPDLIRKLVREGHEIACHSNRHLPVEKQTESEFRDDLLRNRDNLMNAGADSLTGYRAPYYSLTAKTPWAFEILSETGFSYSSSVLPSKNPLYGWPGFGEQPRKMNKGIWEIPVTISSGSFLNVPFAGGVYFRALPLFMIQRNFKKKFGEKKVIAGYFHPYDIDEQQERFMHPDINKSVFYNKLLYLNRGKVFSRLDKIMQQFSPSIITYKKYSEQLNSGYDRN
jgi:polysaccharide deacetylase family protein (PEP-CTERM system associated)